MELNSPKDITIFRASKGHCWTALWTSQLKVLRTPQSLWQKEELWSLQPGLWGVWDHGTWPNVEEHLQLSSRLSRNLTYSQTNLKTTATLEDLFLEFFSYLLCYLCYPRPSSRTFRASLWVSSPMTKSLLITCLPTLTQIFGQSVLTQVIFTYWLLILLSVFLTPASLLVLHNGKKGDFCILTRSLDFCGEKKWAKTEKQREVVYLWQET